MCKGIIAHWLFSEFQQFAVHYTVYLTRTHAYCSVLSTWQDLRLAINSMFSCIQSGINNTRDCTQNHAIN